MHFIDTHVHLQDYKSTNATDIILRSADEGIMRLICVSAEENNWHTVLSLYDANPNVIIPAFGIHPWFVSNMTSGWQDRLEVLLQKYPNALIGECGLDGYKLLSEKQQEVFMEHINIAHQYQRPLIIHAVKAQSWFESNWNKLPEKFVVHSYNGKIDFLKAIIKHGGYIGLSASIFKNKNIAEILKIIPQNKLLLETDGPYQNLYSDKESYPWFIKKQLEKLENITGYSMTEQIYQNSLEFIK